MPFNLKNRNLLKLADFTQEEIKFLLDLSMNLKKAKYSGTEEQRLNGKNIALIFEKASTRTRCAFETAAFDQGAQVTYLGPSGSQIGQKESMKDTARVLGRMYDAIEYRGYGQKIVEELAEYAGVPVYNGLTDEWHPTQALADFMTMMEHSDKPLNQISYCYIGDTRSNMGNTLTVDGCIMGMDVRICGPKNLWPDKSVQQMANDFCKKSGGKLLITDNPLDAVKGVDFIYTDVWLSMGEAADKWAERIELLKDYQVNSKLMKATGNPNTKFLHCLPAFHNRETKVGEEIYQKFGLDGLEVTEEVFESEASKVFDEAENRMHTIKAVMVATLG
jgi:ornithine carbamoyltransferase